MRITEVVGHPGCGKTRACMAAVVARLKSDAGAHAAWLDCQGTFSAARLLAAAHGDAALLARVHVRHTPSVPELCAALMDLSAVDTKELRISLLVVDDAAMPFKAAVDPRDADAVGHRTYMIRYIGLALRRAALRLGCYVLAGNDYATVGFDAGDRPVLRPALGDSWSAVVDRRVLLSECRVVSVLKDDYEEGASDLSSLLR